MPRGSAGKLIVFDDPGRTAETSLSPLDDLRPIYDIRTGALTTLERLEELRGDGLIGVIPRPELAELDRERHPDLHLDPVMPDLAWSGADPIVLLSGRCVLPPPELARLEVGHGVVDGGSGLLLGAMVTPDRVGAVVSGDLTGLRLTPVDRAAVLVRPWHVRSYRDPCLMTDLAVLAERMFDPETAGMPRDVTVIGNGRLTVHSGAKVYPGVVLNIEAGPIVVDEGAVVRPGSIINGPAYIGRKTTILEQGLIRSGSAIGPVCKIAGETGGCIWQGYSNKAHHGYIGDSWIGEWVNLGAGTTGSNLRNDYGEVKVQLEPGGPRYGTKEGFFGALLGDHVKTAINTTIMTGAVLHTGTMWASSEPVRGAVAPMSWVVDGEQGRAESPYELRRFLDVMRSVMSRRKIEPSEAYVEAVSLLAPVI